MGKAAISVVQEHFAKRDQEFETQLEADMRPVVFSKMLAQQLRHAKRSDRIN